MRTAIRRAVAAAAVVPVLALVSACNDDGDASKGSPTSGAPVSPSVSPSASPSPDDPGKTLTKAQLEKALVTSADLPGYVMNKGNVELMDPAENQKADKAECQPIADQLNTKPSHVRKAYAGTTIAKRGIPVSGSSVQFTSELLSSYEPGEADMVIQELKTALTTCVQFKTKAPSGKTTSFLVKPEGEPSVGDAAVSYTLEDVADKAAGVATITVVRTGAVTATYLSIKAAGHGEMPAGLAAKQNEKLKKAATAG